MSDNIQIQQTPISPYDNRDIDVVSPDKKFVACIRNSHEFAMSAPVLSEITVNHILIKDCSPSIMWSDDSRFLAVPQWRLERAAPYWSEIIYILDIRTGLMRSVSGKYIAIRLNRFSGQTIYAEHQNNVIQIDVSKILWL
jgi:hypothetical protein